MLVMVLSISVLSGINFKYELPNTRNELILLVDGSFSGSETEEAKTISFRRFLTNASLKCA